jgi:hypothetical protein
MRIIILTVKMTTTEEKTAEVKTSQVLRESAIVKDLKVEYDPETGNYSILLKNEISFSLISYIQKLYSGKISVCTYADKTETKVYGSCSIKPEVLKTHTEMHLIDGKSSTANFYILTVDKERV